MSVCVLPFANLSGEPEQAYFSEGITEDIVTDLGKVAALFVVATAARAIDAREAARQMNVRHVLTGSVRKVEGRVRISAQVVDGATGGQVWAERYDRDLKDIFALQDEISQAIVAALKVRLLPDEKRAIAKRGTDNVEAYELYRMARQEYVNGDQGDPRWHETIVRLCQRATQIDPRYASAWALWALGHVAAAWLHGVNAEDAAAPAERALALDPNLADAHTVKARILSLGGRHEEAVRQIEIALRLEPKSSLANYSAAVIWFMQQRYGDAIRYFEAAQALDEADFISPQFLIGCYSRAGDGQARARAAEVTLARVEAALAQDRNNGFAMAVGSYALGVLGDVERAEEYRERALLIEPDNVLVPYNVAGSLAADAGQPDAALDLLAPAMARMGPGLVGMAKLAPFFDTLRDHPRFAAMIAEAETRLAQKRPG